MNDRASVDFFALLRQKMDYHAARQEVLTRNIANADTPKFKAMDVEKPDFSGKDFKSELSLAVTQSGHMRPKQSSRFKTERDTNATEVAPNGNNVMVEQQMMKMAENRNDYQATTSLYRKMIELTRLAAGGN